jgi:hypothetical protein
VQRNDVVDVHLLHRSDSLLHILVLIGRQVKATDQRTDFFDAGCNLRLLDGIDRGTMAT